jgi:hypothetical protein
MSESEWTTKVPEESGYYWARFNMMSYDMPVEVDPDGTVWTIGTEYDHSEDGLLFGPRIPLPRKS